MKGFGIYANCFCNVGARNWLNPSAQVQLIPDSYELNRSVTYWYVTGSFFCVLVALLCFAGWCYQEFLQSRLKQAINSLPDDDDSPMATRNMGQINAIGRQSSAQSSRPSITNSFHSPSTQSSLSPSAARGTGDTRGNSEAPRLVAERGGLESEITAAVSSTEQLLQGDMRSRALRSTKSFPGGRNV
jgi:hypothetical protein